jgi:hypothetical protein
LGITILSAGYGFDNLPVRSEVASVTQQINSGATAGPQGAGLFVGSIAQIPDYSSGPITFVVTADNGSSYASSASRAHSAAFTLSSISTEIQSTGQFGPGFTSFAIVPEPSILALSGFGAAAFMLIRRRK